MRFLLVNDDGVGAPGLEAMRAALRGIAENILFVAPLEEQSGASHAITLRHPLAVKRLMDDGVHVGFSVDGSPADCVKVALNELCSTPPDLVISGINFGANVGTSLAYSGTVAAAIEAAMMGCAAVAVSLELTEEPDFTGAAETAVKIIKVLLDGLLRKGEAVNINIPARPIEQIRGVRLVGHHLLHFEDNYAVEKAEDGYSMRLLEGDANPHADGFTDLAVLLAGFVTVTPIRFDMTDERMMARLKDKGPWQTEE